MNYISDERLLKLYYYAVRNAIKTEYIINKEKNHAYWKLDHVNGDWSKLMYNMAVLENITKKVKERIEYNQLFGKG